MSDFRDKVVLITGASSGIGAGVAEHFAGLDACLILTGRNETNLQQTHKKCIEKGLSSDKILLVTADVTKDGDLKRIVDSGIAKFSRIDVLVNNAGVLKKGTIETHSISDFDEVMSVNVRSLFILTQLAVPHLVSTKGTVVNVSSVNGMRSFSGVLAYNISKSAVDQLTRCSALELAPKGVRVNSVNPGVITTDIHKRGGLNDAEYANFLEHSKTTHALGRTGTVQEVANAIEFLASDRSSFITGAQLPVDGGRHAMCPR